MKKRKAVMCAALICAALSGCGGGGSADGGGKTVVKLLHYKLEAVNAFEEMEKRFNEAHDDIELQIESPNEAMVVLKTRLIKEDYPDIVGIGGDINYSNFLDAELFHDISDFEGVNAVKPAYMEIEKDLELIPQDGVYALPYVANCAGILYNREMFREHGWEIPSTWSEFISLCEKIEASGITPLYLGYKDAWTCLSPWNSLAVGLSPSDICAQVNAGTAAFSEAYRETAEKIKTLLDYSEPNPYAYSYNDACTAFARGQSAMYPIGSYAVPQIKSVNPDMDIDSFPFPCRENEADNILTSGVDLHFCVMKECKNMEAAYEVLRFLYQDDTIQVYLDDQNAIPCKEGDFTLPPMLDGMKKYIDEGRVSDFHDHHYPSEMSVDALVQTYLMDSSADAVDTFLARFDNEWTRYNRDLIAKVKKYKEGAQ